MELEITLGIVLVEVAILARCYVMAKRPADPARPRIIPYGSLMGIMMIALLATLAHVVSLVTGHQVQPSKGKFN